MRSYSPVTTPAPPGRSHRRQASSMSALSSSPRRQGRGHRHSCRDAADRHGGRWHQRCPPALAAATVGIAIGVNGSAAAIESADVAFTGHDLRLIPDALAHARRGRRIMTANIGLALAVIIGLFPLALLGIVGLAGVVLVHELAEIVIILNGLRAARRPPLPDRRMSPLAELSPSLATDSVDVQ